MRSDCKLHTVRPHLISIAQKSNKISFIVWLISVAAALVLSCSEKRVEQHSQDTTKHEDPYPQPQDALRVNVTGKHGGRVVTATLSDPKTFNPLLFYEAESQTLNQLMGAGLTRVNLKTQEVETALAKSWENSSDHLTWIFHLRKGLTWSDGHPFSAEDVLFTMQIVNDPKIASSAQDALSINGKQIQWIQKDLHTVVATLPVPYASFLRQLDGATLPMLPKHKWQAAYEDGKFEQMMQVSMNANDLVGLGAFKLKEYRAGQSLTLVRNPRYWKIDKAGKRLPYLDEITFLIFSDINHLQLYIEKGQIDTYHSVRPEDVAELERKHGSTGIRVHNIGPAYESEQIFFNMNAGKNPKTGKPYLNPKKLSWFSDVNFRRAVSHAIDRDSLVRNALYGSGIAASGPESGSNHVWHNDRIEKYPYDPGKSMQLLEASGFRILKMPGGIKLFDRQGNEVRFSLHTNAGNTIRNSQCTLIVSDLDKLGIKVEYTPLEFNTLVDKVTANYDFDAILLGLSHDDVDPSAGMNVWLSSGSLHFWWPNQDVPHTSWEKRIDELMNLQLSAMNTTLRKKYYDEVQEIIADQQPLIYTVTQYVYVCAKDGLKNLQPTIARHRTLWNADELAWSQ